MWVISAPSPTSPAIVDPDLVPAHRPERAGATMRMPTTCLTGVDFGRARRPRAGRGSSGSRRGAGNAEAADWKAAAPGRRAAPAASSGGRSSRTAWSAPTPTSYREAGARRAHRRRPRATGQRAGPALGGPAGSTQLATMELVWTTRSASQARHRVLSGCWSPPRTGHGRPWLSPSRRP